MSRHNHGAPLDGQSELTRRQVLGYGAASALGSGLLLGTPTLWAQEKAATTQPARLKTNIDEILAIPRAARSLPGAFPGRVVQVEDPASLVDGKFNADVIEKMVLRGITTLTRKSPEESFKLLF